MLQNNKKDTGMERTTPKEKYTANQGFTLTELMIAMAIFTILMSGLAAMFNSAVTATRQGYASIDAFESARSAMTTIDRDLSGAFVSDEFGDVYSFYGRPDGFMFVGVLDDGQLGRVTYAFHPEVAKPAFKTTMVERWGLVEQNVRRQFQRLAWESGSIGAAAQTDVQTAVDTLAAAYGVVAVAGIYPQNALVEFSVIVETESLIRYEEPGVADLDTFDMRVGTDAGAANLAWPYVDPVEPTLDGVTGTFGDPTFNQLRFLLGAVDSTPFVDPNDDLRNVFGDIAANGGWWHPVTNDRMYLRVLGRDSFDALLRARKREFWIRMLSGEDMGVIELAPDTANGVAGYWYDEGYEQVNLVPRHPVVNEYVVADGIIARAIILDPATEVPVLVFGEFLDALDAQIKFSYSDGKNGSVNYFNAMENLAD
ncbi:MAG: prepilin-type N-terminal cleavage/methylation domain-containing protein, partial [Candidatus Hydrogenedentes bacterium]|nr:prepilin-type N-terminal cleavage/methylation domain-containing protein [Candidatus Hydrogenedentota bacterium]